MLRKVLVLAFVGLGLGCASIFKEPTPPPQNLVNYYDGRDPVGPLRRVVLLPLESESPDEDSLGLFEDALAAEMQRVGRFELVRPTAHEIADTEIRAARDTGVYRTKDLITLGRRFGADGIIFGAMPTFDPPPRMFLAVKLSLIDARQGFVIWSTDTAFDAQDQKVAKDMHNFHDTTLAGEESLVGYGIVGQSPRLFAKYAARRVIETLDPTADATSRPSVDELQVAPENLGK